MILCTAYLCMIARTSGIFYVLTGGFGTMKKIPTLFERVFENHRKTDILPNATIVMEWVLEGEGICNREDRWQILCNKCKIKRSDFGFEWNSGEKGAK